MKKDLYSRQRLCSDFDDRPIYEPEDNLYPDALSDENDLRNNSPDAQIIHRTKSEIIKNNEKYREN